MKTFIKMFIKGVLLLLLSILISLYLSEILRPDRPDLENNTKLKVKGFYNLKRDSLDILFMGSSHMYYALNPGVIYEESGASSYVFSGECQSIDITYYFLKEALRYQKPSVVVLDTFGLSDSINSCLIEGIKRVNLENLRPSLIKYEAYKNIYKNEDPLLNIFDVSLYHTRWNTLSFSRLFKDYKDPDFGYTLGLNISDNIYMLDLEESEHIEKPEKENIDFLNKIYDLCVKNDIDLVLIKTPYYLSDRDMYIYNYLGGWAKENKVDFINYNKDLSTLDYKFDIDGDIWHANPRGSYKLSKNFSEYLNSRYNFTKNDLYRNQYHDMVVRLKQRIFSNEYNLDKLIKYLKYDNQILLMNYNYFPNSLISNQDKEILRDLGYNFEGGNKKLIIKVDGEDIESYQSDDYFKKEFNIEGHNYLVESNGYITYDNKGVNVANNYACISVVDKPTGLLLDTFCLDTEGALFVHRDRWNEE